MRERGISGGTRRRRKGLTRLAKRAVPAPDLIARDFTAPAPGMKLVGDITYIPTDAGWLYLATWLDLATREIVGYSMADHHRASLVVDALGMAAGRGRLQPGCILHSDRGSEYTSDFQQVLDGVEDLVEGEPAVSAFRARRCSVRKAWTAVTRVTW
jgi:transposase InsO family protein